jgi:molecular chaperone GrpE
MKKSNEKKQTKEKEIDIIKKERDDYLEGWKREKADFINYKKEEYKKIEEFLEREMKSLILKIIPILDNFYRAEKETEKMKDNNLVLGFLKIKEQLNNFLKEEGVEEMEVIGKEFDPNYHEAVQTTEREGGKSGEIVEELEKGYFLNKKVIRPAKVKVIK